MANKQRKAMPFAKFSKSFSVFSEGIQNICKLKPYIKNIIVPENYTEEDVTLDAFCENFPNIIANNNPFHKDEKDYYDKKLWEFHLGHYKWHIKTNNYFSIGMTQRHSQDTPVYTFYITLFGKYDMDKDYLIEQEWKLDEEGEL